LKFTATDRNRLSRFQIDEFATNPFKASVSAVSCKEIIRFFEGIETDLKVSVTESALSVTGPGAMFFTKLLEGEFPETDKLIPKSYIVEVTFERDKLLGALTRATVFAKNKKMAIFNFKDNELFITNRAEVGQVVDSLPCQTLGKEMRIGIDVFYLIEALKTFGEKEVRLGFMSPVQPVLVLPVGEVKSLGLVIPIRIIE
jgi:DNA polymerase-3 subunit beta